MSETFSAYCLTCPECGTGYITYTVIPNPRLYWEEDGEDGDTNMTFFCGNLKDCKCQNCSARFLLQESEDE